MMTYEKYKEAKRAIAREFSPYHATAKSALNKARNDAHAGYNTSKLFGLGHTGSVTLHEIGSVRVEATLLFEDHVDLSYIGRIVEWLNSYQTSDERARRCEPYECVTARNGRSFERVVFASEWAEADFNRGQQEGMPRAEWLAGIKALAEYDAKRFDEINSFVVGVAIYWQGREIGNAWLGGVDILDDYSHLDSVVREIAPEALTEARDWMIRHAASNLASAVRTARRAGVEGVA